MYFFVQFPQAAQRDNTHCVCVLLRHNANPNLMDYSGNTAFHHAISRGSIAIVKMLLEYNVDIEAKTEYGLTPLQLATYENQTEMINFLESMSADAQAVQVSNRYSFFSSTILVLFLMVRIA
eukprot:XP_008769414.1 PREDICTED: ankyrin repeat domain-containing protein 7-like [Rattus norvegicus]